MYETAEDAFNCIATRLHDHPLEKIGRKVFDIRTDRQQIEIIAAVCKNNLQHEKRIPRLFDQNSKIVQDDAEIFPAYQLIIVPSGGKLSITPIEGGFKCKFNE